MRDPEKWAPVFGKDHAQTKSVIPKSGHRFSEKITHEQKAKRDDGPTKDHPAPAARPTEKNHASESCDCICVARRRLGRSRRGCRRELADAAGDHGGAVRGWRGRRCDRTDLRPAPVRAARPAGDHRECRRRGRHGGLRPRGQGGADGYTFVLGSPGDPSTSRSTRPRSTISPPISRRSRSSSTSPRAGGAQGLAGRQPARLHRLRRKPSP